MTAAGFQAALAHLLVDPRLRAALANPADPADPADPLGDGFDLTTDERRALYAIDREALDFAASGIRRARLRTLQRLFAPTLALLGDERAGALLDDMVDEELPTEAADEPAKWLAEGLRLVDRMRAAGQDGSLPRAAADSARLDLARAELRYDPAAALAAAARGNTPGRQLAAGDRPRLSARVRVVAFDHDVVAIRRTRRLDGLPTQPSFLLLVLDEPGGEARLSRLDPAAYRLLVRCDGTATAADLISLDSGARDLVDQAMDRGLLATGPDRS